MAKRGRKKKRVVPRLKLKPETAQTILFIFFLILTVISIFSFLQTGPIPTKINQLLVQYFGFGAVLISFLLLLASFLFAKIKTPLKDLNVFLGFLIMFITMISLLRQGIAGVFFFNQLVSLFGVLPTTFILVFCFIVGFVILFDTSVAQIVKFFVAVFNLIKNILLAVLINLKLKPRKKVKIKFTNQNSLLSRLSPNLKMIQTKI
jgi:hypothetical protein